MCFLLKARFANGILGSVVKTQGKINETFHAFGIYQTLK
jgi:hypothetical protein